MITSTPEVTETPDCVRVAFDLGHGARAAVSSPRHLVRDVEAFVAEAARRFGVVCG